MNSVYAGHSTVGVRPCDRLNLYNPIFIAKENGDDMYQALYRKWRPQTFSDVVGQAAVTDTLKAQIESNRLSHAYLFAGSRGTGKTTCAKILSKAVNCEHPVHGDPCNECSACRGITDGSVMDVVEIDAASNNGVDGVRELRDEAVYSPAEVKKRVYIIDEVHMFSNSAFNALLKILEEPPEHVLFILATTELHKVPATILSRCQRFTFKRISSFDITERLNYIARAEGIVVEPDAAKYIARLADGGMRDALSIFDQCASYGQEKISVQTVEDVVGLAGASATTALLDAVASHDTQRALSLLSEAYQNGRDLISVLNELGTCLRDLLIAKTAPDAKISRLSVSYDENSFRSLSEKFTVPQLIHTIEVIQGTMTTIGLSANRRIDAELCMVKLCDCTAGSDLYGLDERIHQLEKKISSGVFTQQPTVSQAEEKNPSASIDAVASQDEIKSIELDQQETRAIQPETAGQESGQTDFSVLWPEILKIAKADLSPGILPFLQEITPKLTDHVLTLYSDNDLIINLLGQRQNVDPLHAGIQKVLGFDVIIKPVKKGRAEKNTNSLDELCFNIKDKPNVTIIP